MVGVCHYADLQGSLAWKKRGESGETVPFQSALLFLWLPKQGCKESQPSGMDMPYMRLSP